LKKYITQNKNLSRGNINLIIFRGPVRTIYTFTLGYKTDQLMRCRETFAVATEFHIKHVNSICGQNVKLLNVVMHELTIRL
jgi:hypothetical protein